MSLLKNTSNNNSALTLENLSDFSPCSDCQTAGYMAENSSYITDNTTYSQPSQDAMMMVSEQTQAIIWLLNVVGIPAVIMVGFAGNSLCLFVVLGTHLRRQSTGVYLAFLSAVDSVFLFTLMVNWLAWVDMQLANRPGWCQATVYLAYVSSFLSSWTVACFTAERWFVVFHPLSRAAWCTPRRTCIALALGCLIAGLLYSFSFWTIAVQAYEDNVGNVSEYCQALPQYVEVIRIMTIVDSIATFIIPFSIVALLNACIACKIWFVVQRLRTSGLIVSSGGGGGGGGGVGSTLHSSMRRSVARSEDGSVTQQRQQPHPHHQQQQQQHSHNHKRNNESTSGDGRNEEAEVLLEMKSLHDQDLNVCSQCDGSKCCERRCSSCCDLGRSDALNSKRSSSRSSSSSGSRSDNESSTIIHHHRVSAQGSNCTKHTLLSSNSRPIGGNLPQCSGSLEQHQQQSRAGSCGRNNNRSTGMTVKQTCDEKQDGGCNCGAFPAHQQRCPDSPEGRFQTTAGGRVARSPRRQASMTSCNRMTLQGQPNHPNSRNQQNEQRRYSVDARRQNSCSSQVRLPQEQQVSMAQRKQQFQRQSVYQLQANDRVRKTQMKSTKTLLTISTAFLILNLPSHVIRLHLFRLGRSDEATLLWQHALQLIAYVNYASNFYLYAVLSQSFRTAASWRLHRARQAMLQMLCRCCQVVASGRSVVSSSRQMD